MENEEQEEPIGLLLHGERCDTPLWPSRRMENGNGPPGMKEVRSSPRMVHSSPLEEKKLGFPFSENGPSAIQGHAAATSPFSDRGEWD